MQPALTLRSPSPSGRGGMLFRSHAQASRWSFAALAAICVVTTRAEIPLAEKILPADTLFMSSVPAHAKMRAIFEKSPQSRLWNDSSLKPFHDKVVMKWNDEFVVPLERD